MTAPERNEAALPKWAQEELRVARMRRAEAEAELARVYAPATEDDPIVLRRWDPNEPEVDLALPRYYRLIVRVAGGELDVSAGDGRQYGSGTLVIRNSHGGLAVQPVVSNVLTVQAVGR